MKKLLPLLLFFISASVTTSQIITTIAGNGTGGYSGDGGKATSAELSAPCEIALDTAGNIYIADYYNNRIRKVTKSTGIIATIAGNGSLGYYGDGGPATNAELNLPTSITLDTLGNIYITDYANNRLRKIDVSTGIITTIAGNGTLGFSGDGGPATNAELYFPIGIAMDKSGNIFISDGNRIRAINIITGIITTIGGNGTGGYSGDGGPATNAELNFPMGLVLDSSNLLLFADYDNNRIRKINTTTGIISTIAGNGAPSFGGYSGDGGPATNAELNHPSDVKIDQWNNIYIADCHNMRIREVNPVTNIIITIAGNGVAGYYGDGGPATNAELYYPDGLAFDKAGNVYLADAIYSIIRKINTVTGIEQITLPSDIKIYPNPSNGIFNLSISHSELVSESHLTLSLYNAFGEKIFNETLKQVQGDNTINLSTQPSGLYLYRVISETGKVLKTDKLMIVH